MRQTQAPLSIRQKLIRILMRTSVAALLVISVALVSNDLYTFYRDENRDLATLTYVIGKNSAAPLTFDDSEAATEILKALRSKPQVAHACLFGRTGTLLARYDRDRTPDPCRWDPSHETALTRRGIAYSQPVKFNGQQIGSIYLQSDFSSLRAQLIKYFVILLLVLFGAIAVAFVFGLRLQRVISIPIAKLAETAARVSVEKNYSIRAEGEGDDDLGFLVRRFNEMLAEIEKRNDQLQQQKSRLEVEIAARAQADQERNKLLTILEQSPDFIGLAELDGSVAYINPAGRRLIGVETPDELRRLRIEDFQWPEDRDDFGRFLDAASRGDKREGEQRLRHLKTREPIQVDKSSFGLFDPEGVMIGMAAVSRDIRERKRTEQALLESELRFRELTGAIREVFWMIDLHTGQVLYVSPAYEEIWGRSCAALYSNPTDWLLSIHEEDRDRITRKYREPSRDQSLEEEYRIVHSDGTVRWIRDRVFPVRDASGEAIRMAGIAADITEHRQLEAQFRHAQKMEAVGQLAAGIAHEINTPVQYVGDNTKFLAESWHSLVPVLLMARELRKQAGNGGVSAATMRGFDDAMDTADLDYLVSEIPRAIDQSIEGVQRVAKIVRAMKEFSHPGGEQKQAVDINKAIETTITVARNEWKYVAEVHTSFDSSLPLVPCFVGEFNQVILNLLINAAHAIADVVGDGLHGKGNITIYTRKLPGVVEIGIQDTGTGIREEVRPRIFEPFFTTKEVGKGTGQGLALAHSVIFKKHGGKIWFESEWQRGTTFFVHLPLAQAAEEVCQ